MKQKQHNTEEIIRILRQVDGDDTIISMCCEHNISKATFHRGAVNTAIWIWSMPNGSKSWKKRMRS